MKRQKHYPALRRAVNEAWKRHHFASYREAYDKTRVEQTTLIRMRKYGLRPSRGKVIEFAEGLGEPINRWLEVAEYPPIPPDLVEHNTTL